MPSRAFTLGVVFAFYLPWYAAIGLFAALFGLPVGLWLLDRRVIHRPCRECRKPMSRRATVCPYCGAT